MNARRILGTGVAALSLSAVALTVGAAPALGAAFDTFGHAPSPASPIKPPACSIPAGASGIAIASSHGAPLSCSAPHKPGYVKWD